MATVGPLARLMRFEKERLSVPEECFLPFSGDANSVGMLILSVKIFVRDFL